jgi:hypothetical protein
MPGTSYQLVLAERYSGAPGMVARTLECFSYPAGVRLIMLDYDPEPEAIERLTGTHELMDRLARIWPAFSEVGWLATVSTSSAIRDKQTGDWLRPPEGLHVYILATGDVARWRELAKVRLWLAGYGYCRLASPNRHTGVASILERCLVDLTVFSPERLDYVAGAKIAKNAPFYQDWPNPELHPGGVLDLDSLPDVTEEEHNKYTALLAEARSRIEPEQRRLIRAHITSASPGRPESEVEHEINTRLAHAERGELDAIHPLYFDHGITCTAGTFSKAQDGKRLRDPLEPDYGPSQAVFHWRDGNWCIVSWAHGVKRVYQLVPEATESPPPDDENMDDLVARVAVAEEPARERKSQATLLVELAADAELFHTPEGDAYATIPIDGHRETWSLRNRAFRRWLARQFYRAHDKVPGSQALQDALGVLEGKALFDGPEYPVYTRLAEHDGNVYLDLANEGWEAVEITSRGWRVVVEPPVRFRRARGMSPLPHPVAGGRIDDLPHRLNIADDRDWILLAAWLVRAFKPRGPYPVLTLHGEQGSAKSVTTRMLRGIIDPNKAALRSEPRDGRDLVIAAQNGWVISLDNLSHLQPWLSDAICRLATGGGFGTRELYSNAEEVLFDAQRPIILNGIEELATRGDLLDRAIILYLPTIPEAQRRSEAEIWRDFEATRSKILGALLTAVNGALAKVATVKLDRLPRMADFALWVAAAEPALGCPEGAFLEAYTGNREQANELALEAALIVPRCGTCWPSVAGHGKGRQPSCCTP